jgi:hypothetical protein
MSRIHYFQRYSSVENAVTNNTLQLLARIDEYSTPAASRFLTDLTGEPIDIGIEIAQQRRMQNAVPDGMILERSFKILLEAKVDSPVDVDQLLRHAVAFGPESEKVLLRLTREPVGDEGKLAERIREKAPDVVFKNITYEGICEAAGRLFREHEATMLALVEDYAEYCNDANLFDQSQFMLRIVPCGQSVAVHKKHGVYFHPSDRGYSRHAYVGIYAGKTVQAILAFRSVFDVDATDGELQKTLVDRENTSEFDVRIRTIIEEARGECGFEIATGHRFFCGDLFDTDFRESSPGGIQGARFVNLRELLGRFSGTEDVAVRLRGMEWT